MLLDNSVIQILKANVTTNVKMGSHIYAFLYNIQTFSIKKQIGVDQITELTLTLNGYM